LCFFSNCQFLIIKYPQQNAESIIKVARRLELQKLEQQCWRYLVTALNAKTNAEYLHDLADRFDCPPLKLAAWKVLKEIIPDTSVFPGGRKGRKKGDVDDNLQILEAKKNFSTTGLTGPADPIFRKARQTSYGSKFGKGGDDEHDGRDNRTMPSVFDEPSFDHENDEDEDEDDEDNNRTKRRLEDLDDKAPAMDVINAWSIRLKGSF
jgi:hypothetical protein